jgi:hypothetical protein
MKSLHPKLVVALTSLSVLLSVLFVAGESQRADAQGAGAAAPVTLRIGTVAPEGTP